jgi:hypothetical protein
MRWNYRIGTHLFSYKEAFVNNPELAKRKDERLFSIIEVYYDKDGNLEGYAEADPTKNWDLLEDLMGTLDLLMKAKEKPILDIDNWPNEWKNE